MSQIDFLFPFHFTEQLKENTPDRTENPTLKSLGNTVMDANTQENESSSGGNKRVDKLGRVRPRSYKRNLQQPVAKRTCIDTETGSLVNISNDNEVNVPSATSFENELVDTSQDIVFHSVEVDEPFVAIETSNLAAYHQCGEQYTGNDKQHDVLEHLLNDSDHINILNNSETNEDCDWDFISEEKWKDLMRDYVENIDEEDGPVEEPVNEDFHMEEPIYHGHSLSVQTSMVLILLFTICHSVSGSQLADLLTLISMHCLQTHPGLKSIHMFKKYFVDMKSPMKKHYYCSNCMSLVEDGDILCPFEKCKANLTRPKSKRYFIEIPIEDQLINFFKRPETLNLLKQRFLRRKNKKECIEDIYDGNIYKKLSAPGGPLSEDFPYNLSFTWNTDGVPVFKSSKFSLWPLYLVINELPYKQRMKKENMLLCGLWFGESKPAMTLFTKTLFKSLKRMENEGIEIELDEEKICSKGFLICGTADLPAKSLILNCNQFNGAFSCLRCMHGGETYKTKKGGSVHIFPYDASKPLFEEREVGSCIQDAIKAVEQSKAVNGIKGPSVLMTLKYYDFVKSSAIDYMHGVLLGVTKLMINLWIGSQNSKESFSVSTYIDIIDERLTNIKPPSYITRVPRSISSHFKYWKASELRSWLFFYSLPILKDILASNYYMHYASLVEAIYLLCTDSVSPEDIQKSSNLLSYFVHMFPALYSERYITLNMHSLLHLPQCVQDCGPLWVYSCFPFEDANGYLLDLFHGTQNVEMQIVSSISIVQNLPKMLESISAPHVEKFVKKLKHKQLYNKVFKSVASTPIGICSDTVMSNDVYSRCMLEIGYKPTSCYLYKRISHRGVIIHSTEYSCVKVRNTCTVKYFDIKNDEASYGIISYFVLAKRCACLERFCKCDATLLAVMCKLCKTKESIVEKNFLDLKVPHIKVVKKSNNVHVIDVSKIISIVVNVDFANSSETYLCEIPNLQESD